MQNYLTWTRRLLGKDNSHLLVLLLGNLLALSYLACHTSPLNSISHSFCRFQGQSHPVDEAISLSCPHEVPGAVLHPGASWSRQTVTVALACLPGLHTLALRSQGSSHRAWVTLPAGARPLWLSNSPSCLPWGPSEVTWGSNKASSSSPLWRC